ncbi:hypothetical protein PCK1_001025 [Pneumocystis canis]|nr:hypothetical protein PCK1_001025 [Pneumocystis canis]
MLFDATSCIEPPLLKVRSIDYLNPSDSALFLSQYLQTRESTLHTSHGSLHTRMALQNAGTHAQLYKILQYLETHVISTDSSPHNGIKKKKNKKDTSF